MTFQVPVHISEDSSLPEAESIRDEQITIMDAENSVLGQTACPDGKMPHRFELTLSPASQPEDNSGSTRSKQTNTENEERR